MTTTQQSHFDVRNGSLVQDTYSVEYDTQRIHSRNRLEKYLKGTHRCNIVAYTINLEFIEHYIENIGMRELNVIIGKEVSISRKRSLDPELIAKLARWQAEGRLTVRVPIKNEMHEKLFFCTSDDEKWFKDIHGSANPTITGSGSSQSNRISIFKIQGSYQSHEAYLRCMNEWEKYLEMSQPFLDSLIELLPDNEEEWEPKIVRWLESDGDLNLENTIEVRVIQQKMEQGMFEEGVRGNREYVMSTDLYDDLSVDKAIEILNTKGFGIERDGNSIRAPVAGLDIGLSNDVPCAPRMNFVDGKIYLKLGREYICRTADKINPTAIKEELEKLEHYIDSVRLANRGDKQAQMALAEFILACINAPFEYRYMEERRKRFKRQKVGPRMTSYVGMAGNGKSYACRYVMRMLTGQHIEALTSKHFTKSNVLAAARSGQCFPLIFDDLEKKRINEWGKWGKLFWDENYTNGNPYPQLLVTANDHVDNSGPLGRRVREIAMHAAFNENQKNSELVENLLENTSDIFSHFSLIMEDMYQKTEWYNHGDELSTARSAISKLYNIAEKKQPDWWVKSPVEQVNDSQAYQWLDILNKGIGSVQIERDEIIVQFDGEGAKWDALRMKNLLPTSVAPEMLGSKIRIRNPDVFIQWIRNATVAYSNPLRRPMRKLLRRRFS